jgi:hypothetical protein
VLQGGGGELVQEVRVVDLQLQVVAREERVVLQT